MNTRCHNGTVAGIKLLLDLVPNHTSDEHEWFQKSLKKIDPYTDYYVWQDGKINDTSKQRTPPNNWVSGLHFFTYRTQFCIDVSCRYFQQLSTSGHPCTRFTVFYCIRINFCLKLRVRPMFGAAFQILLDLQFLTLP